MRLLFGSDRPPYPFLLGGAQRSNHELLTGLVARGIDVHCVASRQHARVRGTRTPQPDRVDLGIRAVTPLADGDRVDVGYPVEVVEAAHARFRALLPASDVVLAHADGAAVFLRAAADAGKPGILYVRDAAFSIPDVRDLVRRGVRVVCNGAFLQRSLARAGVAATCIHSPVGAAYAGQGDERGAITLVNAKAVKGLDLFLDLAARLPEAPFLLVESWALTAAEQQDLRRRLEALPNVRFLPRQDDAGVIYRQTSVLLVPSVIHDAFPRVVREAHWHGIPVVGSGMGGVPDAIGDGGIVVGALDRPHAWVAAILTALSPAHRPRLVEAARANVVRPEYHPDRIVDDFLAVCADAMRAGVPAAAPLDPHAARWSAQVVGARRPCAVLVFGLGATPHRWTDLNPDGETVFVEDAGAPVRPGDPAAVRVAYATDREAVTAPTPPPALALPEALRSRRWDVIVVDAPRDGDHPGRQGPMYEAARIGRAFGQVDALVVAPDPREVVLADALFGARELVQEAGTLRHYRIGYRYGLPPSFTGGG